MKAPIRPWLGVACTGGCRLNTWSTRAVGWATFFCPPFQHTPYCVGTKNACPPYRSRL